ncbi:MAG: hypothetical protein KC416_15815, partial [Myxococcales bacterium]|nr:hypothetical protein [Myxococcales bacterium]
NTFTGISTVTKYANDIKDCVDRNNSTTIETSRDVNGDGTIDMNQALPDNQREFWGTDDECILWTRDAGPVRGTARALAVGTTADGSPGDVFVGLNGTGDIVRMDPTTGDTKATTNTYDGTKRLYPYGAATAADGKVWFVHNQVQLSRPDILGYLDPSDNSFVWAPPVPDSIPGCKRPYGMTLDPQGRVWMGNAACETELLYYEPDTMTWGGVDVPDVRREGVPGTETTPECVPMVENMQTVAVCSDGMSSSTTALPATARGLAASYKSIWFAASYRCPKNLTIADVFAACNGWSNKPENCCDKTAADKENLIGQVDIATKKLVMFHALPEGKEIVGVGYSPNQKIWAAGQYTDNVSFADFDVNDNRISPWQSQAVGNRPYTYSDFIGFGLNSLAQPQGYYRFIVEGCDEGKKTVWKTFSYEADTPPKTQIRFSFRTAKTEADVTKGPWEGPTDSPSPIDLTKDPVPLEGRFLQVEVALETTDPTARPKIRDIDLTFSCEALGIE